MSLKFVQVHPFVRQVVIDKCRGVLMGSALGDALEFLPGYEVPRAYPESPPIALGQPFRSDSHRDKFSPGSWTDDTDHALLLVLAYIHLHETSPPVTPSALALSFAARLHVWCNQGLLALGTPPNGLGQTIGGLALQATFPKNPRQAALESWRRAARARKPASNGSVMRTHPLGIIAVGLSDEEAAFDLAAELCHTTHVDPRCVLSCMVVVGLLRSIIRGEVRTEDDLDKFLERAVTWITRRTDLVDPWTIHCESDTNNTSQEGEDDYLHLSEFYTATGSTATLDSLTIDGKNMGYTYTCLGSAVIVLRAAIRRSSSICEPETTPTTSSQLFRTLMTDLILRGGDADTNATVAGALLGAWFGGNGLPEDWIVNLRNSSWLERKAVRFIGCVGLLDAEGAVRWWEEEDADARPDGGRGFLTQAQMDARDKAMVHAVLEKKKQRDKEEERKKAGNVGKKWFGF